MAWSSAAVSTSRPTSPRLNRPRKSKRLFGRNRLPICSARNGGLVRDSKVSSAMLLQRQVVTPVHRHDRPTGYCLFFLRAFYTRRLLGVLHTRQFTRG